MINPTGYKSSYKSTRTVAELTDSELEYVWWAAFDRDKCDTISCDIPTLRAALLEKLRGK